MTADDNKHLFMLCTTYQKKLKKKIERAEGPLDADLNHNDTTKHKKMRMLGPNMMLLSENEDEN